MCGIAGIYAYRDSASRVDGGELLRIRDHMAARGPDGAGLWLSDDGRAGLAHRRLSIIDLSDGAAQPMPTTDGRYTITFNGEIYNFKTLRKQLEDKGYVFRTHSDTEVLLHLYVEKGEGMVTELRGMFALAIWDQSKRALFLARDPYGIKPLYYADDGRTFRFASQVKALLAGGHVSTEPDSAGRAGFYLFGSVPEPYTVYRGVRALPAGATLWLDLKGVREPKHYFSVAASYCRAEVAPIRRDGKALQERVREALLDSVRHHLVADVPVGAFLSAGVDSGALVGLMRDAGQEDIQTVTLAFEEFHGGEKDEAPLAAKVADHYGVRHTIRTVTEAEFREDLPLILKAMDQPSVDGINTWFVSKAARELGLKVAISGLGGDELLGGYNTFRQLPRLVSVITLAGSIPGFDRAFSTAVKSASMFLSNVPPKLKSLFEYGNSYASAYLLSRGLFLPNELPALFEDAEIVRDGLDRLQPLQHIGNALVPYPETDFGKIATLESSFYMRNQLLRDTDWASMAHSLEVRVPLVDVELLQLLAPITVGTKRLEGKVWLANAPTMPLPSAITARRKTGFGLPIASWIRRSAMSQPAGRVLKPWARQWACELLAA